MTALKRLKPVSSRHFKPRKGSNLAVPLTIRLVFEPPQINGGVDCGFLCPATDGPPVPSFVDDQDEDEPEDQSEDQSEGD